MRYYYRRPWLGRILAVLVSIPIVAVLAKLTYEWLIPVLPLVGAAILIVIFWAVGFRRRY